MKKAFSTLLFVAAIAATAHAQISLEGGVNMANMSVKSGDQKLSTKFKTGAAFGVVADIALGDHVYFEPGLFFEMRGCKITSDPKGAYNISALGIPLNIEYKSGEKCGARFLAGIGPYIGRNLSGTYSRDAFGPLDPVSENITFGVPKGDMKKVDVGLGLNVGYILRKHLYARLRYQMGLSNLHPSDEVKIKTSSIGITLGFLFANCKKSGPVNAFKIKNVNHWRGMSKGRYSRRPKYPRY